MYGDRMIDFAVSVNCCVLNGITGIYTKDDYISVYQWLRSGGVVPAPYDLLSHFSDFNIIRARQLFCDSGGVGFIGPSHYLPDHSLLTWKPKLACPDDCISTSYNKKTTQFIQHGRDVATHFLQGRVQLVKVML